MPSTRETGEFTTAAGIKARSVEAPEVLKDPESGLKICLVRTL